MSRNRYYFIIILILGSLATISPFSIDMYLPGFPAIATNLHTTIDQVQLSLTAYLVGICIGQLFYGPLLDRFGRKKPLFIGLGIYIAASLGCALTTSVDQLIFMRFLQGVGGCVGMVAAQALVRDIFPANKTAQAFSLLTLVIAVSPMVAPTVGGYMTAFFGWHSIFITLAAISLVIALAAYFYLPTGKAADSSISLSPASVAKGYYTVVTHSQFLTYSLAGGLATAAPFAYIAGSAEVFMNQYHMSEQHYGWVFAFIAFGMVSSTQLNHVLVGRFTSQQIIKAALWYQMVVGGLLVLGLHFHWFDLYELVGFTFLLFIGQGLIGPNTTALSLAPFSRHAGSASALLGSWRMFAGGIITATVSILHNGTAMPMVGAMVACSYISMAILLLGGRVIVYRASKKVVEDQVTVLV